jgi:hypothetical protein
LKIHNYIYHFLSISISITIIINIFNKVMNQSLSLFEKLNTNHSLTTTEKIEITMYVILFFLCIICMFSQKVIIRLLLQLL